MSARLNNGDGSLYLRACGSASTRLRLHYEDIKVCAEIGKVEL